MHPVSRNITICGKEWDDVNEENFASEALLEEEALEPDELQPFDLSVVLTGLDVSIRFPGNGSVVSLRQVIN